MRYKGHEIETFAGTKPGKNWLHIKNGYQTYAEAKVEWWVPGFLQGPYEKRSIAHWAATEEEAELQAERNLETIIQELKKWIDKREAERYKPIRGK